MHTLRHQDSNFTGEFFNLVWIILLICQQRFLFDVFYYFHKNTFLMIFILGVNVLYIYAMVSIWFEVWVGVVDSVTEIFDFTRKNFRFLKIFMLFQWPFFSHQLKKLSFLQKMSIFTTYTHIVGKFFSFSWKQTTFQQDTFCAK